MKLGSMTTIREWNTRWLNREPGTISYSPGFYSSDRLMNKTRYSEFLLLLAYLNQVFTNIKILVFDLHIQLQQKQLSSLQEQNYNNTSIKDRLLFLYVKAKSGMTLLATVNSNTSHTYNPAIPLLQGVNL